jgi:protein-disulfide isomerase
MNFNSFRKNQILSWTIIFLIILILSACGPAVDPGLINESEVSQSEPENRDNSPGAQEDTPPTSRPDNAADVTNSESPIAPKLNIDQEAVATGPNGLEVGFTDDGHPYKGNPSAPIVIKEFSDFQCPFCARFTEETFPTIEDDLIAEGRAVLIFYDFPLASLHAQAFGAANAARCAGEQGAAAFWEMHDLLFDDVEEWSQSEPLSVFSSFAADIGLDIPDFEKCFNVDRYRGQINEDLAVGQASGVTGTPSFLINNQLFVGAQPTKEFLGAVDIVQNGGQLASVVAANPEPQPAVAPTPAIISNNFAGELGDPSAPITIVEFTDYQCPYCSRHSLETLPQIVEKLIDSGQVYYQIKDLPLEQLHPNARLAAAAARCAGDEDEYWSMHDLIFDRQSEWAPLGNREVTDAFNSFAREISLNETSFSDCLSSGKHDASIDDNLAEAGALGISGTPFFFIDGYPLNGARPFEHFEYAVTLAEQGRLSEAFAPQEPEPAGPQDVPIGDAFAIGDEDAPIIIVEYTDYQCPFCSRHYEQTFPLILENFVETGIVRYVFKDFPLTTIHPQAEKAAEAARCAGDQGQYLGMHNILFERQGSWGLGDPSENFVNYAEELGIDASLFKECLASGQYEEAVKADLNEGIQFGVTGTPAFFINGYPVSGAQPYSLFEEAVSTLLER